MKTTHRAVPSALGDVPQEGSFELPVALNRSRVAPLVSGALLMVLGALTFIYLAGGDPSRPVVMMARDVPRGAVVSPEDVVRTDIASDTAIGVIPWEAVETTLIGNVAAADLPGRSLPSPASVSAEPALPDGARAIGVVLNAGAVPTDSLGIGDVVDVISVADEAPSLIAAAVPVQRVVGDEGRYFVTLIVNEADAVAVSAAAGADEIRLAKVPT